MPRRISPDIPVRAYPPEAVLELPHVAEWMRSSEDSVDRMDIPCFYIGTKSKRFLAKHVLARIEELVEQAQREAGLPFKKSA